MSEKDPTPGEFKDHGALRQRRSHNDQTPLSSDTSIKIRETSPHGTHLSTHTLTSTDALTTQRAPKIPSTAPSTSLLLRLLTPFLPINYPHSVTPDYTPYQIYDSIQAFASTIASLLASRAVLTSLGYGSESSDSSATAVTLVSIIQNSIGQIATIFFAHHFALRIEAEVKFYRFLADIVNDMAFVLDVLSPSLPGYARVPTLCVGSICRSICGVCGGSSKAILSAHFARAGNIGELNAKDGSQETVVTLVASWVGGIVVSKVEGRSATLVWMFVLLAFHLWANYMAVSSVRLRSLNRTRATKVIGNLLQGEGDVSFEAIGKGERLFVRGDQISIQEQGPGSCIFGNLADLVAAFDGTTQHLEPSKGSNDEIGTSFVHLLDFFQDEQYVLWLNARTQCLVIVLKDRATPETEVKAWCHAMRLTRNIARDGKLMAMLMSAVLESLEETQEQWKHWRARIEVAGWDLTSSNLAMSSGSRIQIQVAE